MFTCRLCKHAEVTFFAQWKSRTYFFCSHCWLIQLAANQLPDPETEQQEYNLHNNDPTDLGYRRFLAKVTQPVLQWLEQRQGQATQILDFGSGPQPAMAAILQEQGWTVINYDPFFAPDPMVLRQQYDLIICTEVVEHFHNPQDSWNIMIRCLKNQGQLVIMTSSSDQKMCAQSFQQWSYIREQSHVSFYHSKTMKWLAKHHNLHLQILHPNVFWFTRTSRHSSSTLL